jgi:hypothetical protein
MMFIRNLITLILVVRFAFSDNFSSSLNISSNEVPFENYSITGVPQNDSFVINLDTILAHFAYTDNFSTSWNISSNEVPFENYSITEEPNDSFIIHLDTNAYGDISQIAPLDFASDRIYGDVTMMKDLFKNILYDYDTRIRPIWDQSAPINVSTKFVPMSILDFDIASQTFSILGYFRVWWRDELLTWNEEHYSQTNTVKIPIKEIWTPRLIILKVSI